MVAERRGNEDDSAKKLLVQEGKMAEGTVRCFFWFLFDLSSFFLISRDARSERKDSLSSRSTTVVSPFISSIVVCTRSFAGLAQNLMPMQWLQRFALSVCNSDGHEVNNEKNNDDASAKIILTLPANLYTPVENDLRSCCKVDGANSRKLFRVQQEIMWILKTAHGPGGDAAFSGAEKDPNNTAIMTLLIFRKKDY